MAVESSIKLAGITLKIKDKDKLPGTFWFDMFLLFLWVFEVTYKLLRQSNVA